MDHKHDPHESHHIIPMSVLVKTLSALLVLTVITVGASLIDFGKLNIFVSMGIATLKAALVMLFFMGLKYDTILNRVVICSSFVALFLLMFFTASDLWTRERPDPAKVKAAAVALSLEEFNQLKNSTPELVSRGKEVYKTNCAVCHGDGGNGDGPGGAALNPKPRNFKAAASEWKNGSSTESIYVTLANGIPGSGMAAYKALSPGDRWALVHFVHTLTGDVQKQSKGDEKFAQAVKEDGIGAAGVAPKVELPIDFAIERATKN